MLHIINQSPFATTTLASCLRVATPGHAILFIEDGVLAVLKNTEHSSLVLNAAQNLSFYALKPDIEARGLNDKILEQIQLIDYQGFVELTVKYNPIQSWT